MEGVNKACHIWVHISPGYLECQWIWCRFVGNWDQLYAKCFSSG